MLRLFLLRKLEIELCINRVANLFIYWKWALNFTSVNTIIKQKEGISLLFIPSLLFTSQHFTQKSMNYFLFVFLFFFLLSGPHYYSFDHSWLSAVVSACSCGIPAALPTHCFIQPTPRHTLSLDFSPFQSPHRDTAHSRSSTHSVSFNCHCHFSFFMLFVRKRWLL